MTDPIARARPLIEAALVHAHGTHELVDVLEGVAAGRLQIWIGAASVAVTEVLRFPRLSALNVFLASGPIEELKAALPGMEAWARGAGCRRIMFSGRLDAIDGRASGWERLLPEFRPGWIHLSKELEA